MNIISVDLPWKENTKGRIALANADPTGNVSIDRAFDDYDLLEQVSRLAEPGSIILLDIPIDGCHDLRNVKGKHFRPVDKALAHQGIWIQPSYRAGNRGRQLSESLERDNRRIEVYEIYPYAVYKLLAYLSCHGLLHRFADDRLETLLDDSFRKFRPRKYKAARERNLEILISNMKYLYDLLTDARLGLRFSRPLTQPDSSFSLSQLNRLSDEYDACLGAIAGIHLANKSCYTCIAGDSQSGSILLLADRWLSEQLGREVCVY